MVFFLGPVRDLALGRLGVWTRARRSTRGARARAARGLRRHRMAPWRAARAVRRRSSLAAVGGVVLDIPALLFGVKVTSATLPPGLSIADTVVQDIGFVLVGRLLRPARWPHRALLAVRAAPPGSRLVLGCGHGPAAAGRVHRPQRRVDGSVNTEKEKVLETLGTNEGAALLVLSAGLTCVVAPIVRGVPVSRATSSRRCAAGAGRFPPPCITGLVFGGVHVGSAPALDLVPLAALGFGLCLLYRCTGLAVSVHHRPRAQQLRGVRGPWRTGGLGRRSCWSHARSERSAAPPRVQAR